MRLVLIHFITIRTSKHLQILKDQRQIILLRALLNPSQQRGHYTAKIYVSTCRDIPRCKLAVIYLPKIMKIPVRLSLIIGIGLLLFFSAALSSLTRHAAPMNVRSAALYQSPTSTPQVEDVSEIGSTDEIMVLGGIIVLIVIVPIFLYRKSWMNTLSA